MIQWDKAVFFRFFKQTSFNSIFSYLNKKNNNNKQKFSTTTKLNHKNE